MHYRSTTKPIGGKIKTVPDDFIVEEIPQIETGRELIALMEKKGLNTIDAISNIAKSLGIAKNSIGYAGLKDKNALTRQFISLGKIGPSLAEKINSENLRLYDFQYGKKIYPGSLKGNKFTITIRGIKKDLDIENIVNKFSTQIEKKGIGNYFGQQRFGIENKNIDIGLSILNGKQGTGKREIDKLALNSVQSMIFNESLEEFLKSNPKTKNFQAPIVGFGTKLGKGKFDSISKKVIERHEIDIDKFRDFGARGQKRVILIKPKVNLIGMEKDELSRGKIKVILSFTLDSGQYATVVLKELMKD